MLAANREVPEASRTPAANPLFTPHPTPATAATDNHASNQSAAPYLAALQSAPWPSAAGLTLPTLASPPTAPKHASRRRDGPAENAKRKQLAVPPGWAQGLRDRLASTAQLRFHTRADYAHAGPMFAALGQEIQCAVDSALRELVASRAQRGDPAWVDLRGKWVPSSAVGCRPRANDPHTCFYDIILDCPKAAEPLISAEIDRTYQGFLPLPNMRRLGVGSLVPLAARVPAGAGSTEPMHMLELRVVRGRLDAQGAAELVAAATPAFQPAWAACMRGGVRQVHDWFSPNGIPRPVSCPVITAHAEAFVIAGFGGHNQLGELVGQLEVPGEDIQLVGHRLWMGIGGQLPPSAQPIALVPATVAAATPGSVTGGAAPSWMGRADVGDQRGGGGGPSGEGRGTGIGRGRVGAAGGAGGGVLDVAAPSAENGGTAGGAAPTEAPKEADALADARTRADVRDAQRADARADDLRGLQGGDSAEDDAGSYGDDASGSDSDREDDEEMPDATTGRKRSMTEREANDAANQQPALREPGGGDASAAEAAATAP